jgi:predicted transcriptional regulator
MSKRTGLHPKAFLTSKRNVRAGLVSRSKILSGLERGHKSAPELAKETKLSYECVAYHLKAMKRDRLVERVSARKPFTWSMTRFGQQKLSAD